MSHLPTYYDIAAMVEQAVARQEGRGQEASMVDHEAARQDSRQVARGPPEFRQAVRGLPTNIRQDIRGLPGSRQDAHRSLHGAHQELDRPMELGLHAARGDYAADRQDGRNQGAAMADHDAARQESRQVGREPPEFRQAARGLPTNIRQDIRGLPGSRQDAHRSLHGAHQEWDRPTELLREARGFPRDIRPEFQGPPVIRRDSRDALHGNRPTEQALEEGEVRGATHEGQADPRHFAPHHAGLPGFRGSQRGAGWPTPSESAGTAQVSRIPPYTGYAYSTDLYGGPMEGRRGPYPERPPAYLYDQSAFTGNPQWETLERDSWGRPEESYQGRAPPQPRDTTTPQRFPQMSPAEGVSGAQNNHPGTLTATTHTGGGRQPSRQQEERTLGTPVSGKREREEDLVYVDTNAHDGQTWGGRNRGFEPPAKDLRIFSHFTLVFDGVELHLQTQKDAHARATAIRGLLRTIDRAKLQYITTDLILDFERVKAALLSGAEDTDGLISHPGFDRLEIFQSVQTIPIFTDADKLKSFVTHTGWITASYEGLTLRDCLPTHTQPPAWDEGTDSGERTLLSAAVTNFAKGLQVVHHGAFQCVDIPTQILPDRRFGTISNGLIRYHLEEAITMWAQDISTRDCPSAAQYAHCDMNDAEGAADLLGRYLRDVMLRLEGIGYQPVAPHLRPYEAYPHSRFFRPGGPFRRIQATEVGAATGLRRGPSPTTALRPTPPSFSSDTLTTPPFAAPVTAGTSHPCFWHICHLAGLTKRRSGDLMVCTTPSCPDPHPTAMPVLTRDMVQSWTTHPPTKSRLQTLLPQKIPPEWL